LGYLAASVPYFERIVTEPSSPMTAQTILLVAGALIGVIALIAAAARLFQFSGWQPKPRSGRTLSLQESIALDPRRRIHLVQCGPRQVLLLTGGGQDVVIVWLPDP
jgi:flagellar protein FliO/FliZ